MGEQIDPQESKKEESDDNSKSSGNLFGAAIRGFAYGAGIAGAILVAINAQFGPQITAYFDSSKKEQYYVATIEQQSNEQKRSNQLIEQLQKTLDGLRIDLDYSRQTATRERSEQNEKLDLVVSENKIEKKERERIKKELELTSLNTNQLAVDLRKCKDECAKGRK